MKKIYFDKLLKNKCFFEILKKWSLIKVFGLDSTQYLQSHITIDILNLNNKKHMLCANCNSHGKVQSVLQLFNYKNGYAYIQRKSICKIQMNALKKYSVFSNVTIEEDNNYFLLGIFGKYVRTILSLYFCNLPHSKESIIFDKNIIILWFGGSNERFLLILKKKKLEEIKLFLLKKNILNLKNAWSYLHIKSGIPILEYEVFNKFFPQEINLDLLEGINFKKGCYCGQEMISKIHFKNLIHKRLYCLIGTTNFKINIFSFIEIYDGYFWKKVGNIIYSLHIKDNLFLIQCVLYKKKLNGNSFRITTDINSKFSMFKYNY